MSDHQTLGEPLTQAEQIDRLTQLLTTERKLREEAEKTCDKLTDQVIGMTLIAGDEGTRLKVHSKQVGIIQDLRAKLHAAELARDEAVNLIAALVDYADRAYCRGVDRSMSETCKGADAKIEGRTFGRMELDAHCEMSKAFGAHFGIHAALEEYRKSKTPPTQPIAKRAESRE